MDGPEIDDAETWTLWPEGAPGREAVDIVAEITERSADPAIRNRIERHTTDPTLTIVRPDRPNGAGLLVIQGGGFAYNVIDGGLRQARIFADAGLTCFVLRHRLPGDGWPAGPDAPLQDAQRAIRTIRARADEWGIDPNRIGVLGSSAGGHLAGLLSTRTDRTYPAIDAIDAVSGRPDVVLLLYPVVTMAEPHAHPGSRDLLLGPEPSPAIIDAYSLDQASWREAGPVWIAHACDDSEVVVENATLLFAALRRDGVRTELHLFEQGEHSFQHLPASVWSERAFAFVQRHLAPV